MSIEPAPSTATDAERLVDFVFIASGLVLGAEAQREFAEAIKRAHQHGHDAGRAQQHRYERGERCGDYHVAWLDFMATECPEI
jgi:hypothetical protein